MNLYNFMSIGYDLLDKIWFSDKGKSSRDVIEKMIPDDECSVLDMCFRSHVKRSKGKNKKRRT